MNVFRLANLSDSDTSDWLLGGGINHRPGHFWRWVWKYDASLTKETNNRKKKNDWKSHTA